MFTTTRKSRLFLFMAKKMPIQKPFKLKPFKVKRIAVKMPKLKIKTSRIKI